jgi:hypothetical protein
MQLELGFAAPSADDETDEALSTRGYVTVTPLAGVTEDGRAEVDDAVAGGIYHAAGVLGIPHPPSAIEQDGPAA